MYHFHSTIHIFVNICLAKNKKWKKKSALAFYEDFIESKVMNLLEFYSNGFNVISAVF